MDITPGTILAGTDGSPSADAAVRWASVRAAAEQRSLTLLMALHPATPTWIDPGIPDLVAAHEQSLRTRAEDTLTWAHDDVSRSFPDLQVHEVFCLADPRQALIQASRTADLVVVGSRGHGHLKSLVLGSTSVAVIRHSECPVVVHRPTPAAPARRGVAVGADATHDSLTVLDFAYREADRSRLPLTVVHSLTHEELAQGATTGRRGATTEDLPVGLAKSLASMSEKYPEVEVHTVVEDRMPERCLLDLTESMDLLVVGVHHQSRSAQFMFGSASVWLMEHADCPVAVVPVGAR